MYLYVKWNKFFQNLFRFIQYGCRSFSIDASSDPTKFQDDWPSGSRLIGAWSSDFAFNVFVCQVEPLVNILVSSNFQENERRSTFCHTT